MGVGERGTIPLSLGGKVPLLCSRYTLLSSCAWLMKPPDLSRWEESPESAPLTSIRYAQSSLKGCSRLASRIFLMTRTLFGDLFHVNLWLAGSWMCL